MATPDETNGKDTEFSLVRSFRNKSTYTIKYMMCVYFIICEKNIFQRDMFIP